MEEALLKLPASVSDHLHRLLPSSPTSLLHVALKREDESPDVSSFPCVASGREAEVQLSEQDRHQDELLRCKSEVDSSLADQCLRNEECCSGRSICDSNVTKLDSVACNGQCDGGATPSIGVCQIEKMDVDSCTPSENLAGSFGDVANEYSGNRRENVMVKSEITKHSTCDHLDQISLKERQRMLLSRKHFRLENAISEDIPVAFFDNVMQQSNKKKGGASIAGENAVMATFQPCGNPGSNDSDLFRSMISSPQQNVVVASCSSTASGEQDDERRGTIRGHSSVKIKEKPLDNSDFSSRSRCVKGDFSFKMLSVKQEQRAPTEFSEEEIDNMLLRDRMNLLLSQKDSEASLSGNFGHLFETVPSAVKCSSNSTEGAKSVSISRPKKRKKTATDSVQTALEEDAPELLQVLADKGVLLDEIKLYGMMEIDEALDESFCEDGFSQLEAVISKLFSQRQSFIKLAPLRCTNDSRPSYCLASLFSLVEQARYLQSRNWPVEWGWCRDLQSFIFVFARHNRIVLERPEYGYATYFFELVHSLPIEWQIKRLVTAMKLTSCGRLSLIENKALMVGEDLSKGEAQVLMEYGWEPNTGLGTMLKYRDRVVHDRKNESEGSEWRSKIGKMLMDGYSGGTLVVTNIPKKVHEFTDVQYPEIKLEF